MGGRLSPRAPGRLRVLVEGPVDVPMKRVTTIDRTWPEPVAPTRSG